MKVRRFVYLGVLYAVIGIIALGALGCSSETPGRLAVVQEDVKALEGQIEALQAELELLKAVDKDQMARITQIGGTAFRLALMSEFERLEDVKVSKMTDQQLAILLKHPERAADAKEELESRQKK